VSRHPCINSALSGLQGQKGTSTADLTQSTQVASDTARPFAMMPVEQSLE